MTRELKTNSCKEQWILLAGDASLSDTHALFPLSINKSLLDDARTPLSGWAAPRPPPPFQSHFGSKLLSPLMQGRMRRLRLLCARASRMRWYPEMMCHRCSISRELLAEERAGCTPSIHPFIYLSAIVVGCVMMNRIWSPHVRKPGL